METPIYQKIVSRIPIRYKQTLNDITAKAGFKSIYEIQQNLAKSVLRSVNGESAPDFANQLLQPIEREPSPEGHLKIVSRFSEDDCLILDWLCKRIGISSLYGLMQRLTLNYLHLYETRATSMFSLPGISEEVNEEFIQFTDWQEMEYIKPKRRCNALSVFSDCETHSEDIQETDLRAIEEWDSDDLNEESNIL